MSPPPSQPHQIIYSTLLLFLTGSFLSLSIFTIPVESSSPLPHALDYVWSTAMSLLSLFAIPFMFLAGNFLNDGRTVANPNSLPFARSKTARIRILALLAAACTAFLGVAAWGISMGNAFLVGLAVTMQGIPFNIYFLIPIELLAEWMPEHRGLAIGCGQAAFGIGTMVFSAIFEALITNLGCINAVYMSAALLVVLGTTLSCLLEWPPLEFVKSKGAVAAVAESHATPKIPARKLYGLMSFWLCVFSIATSQTGFVFIACFFKIGLSFHQKLHSLVGVFEGIALISALTRPFSGMLADSCKWGNGHFSMGSKNVMSLTLLVQALFFFLLIPISNLNIFLGFVLATGVIIIAFATGECITMLLIRDIFGSENSSLVYGAGASIGFGVGSFLPLVIFEAVSRHAEGGDSSPAIYNLFYLICVFWSITGLVANLMLSRYKPTTSTGCAKDRSMSTILVDDSSTIKTRQDPSKPLIITGAQGYGAANNAGRECYV